MDDFKNRRKKTFTNPQIWMVMCEGDIYIYIYLFFTGEKYWKN